MSNSTCPKAIKEVLGALHIPCSHVVHLGHILGAKILKLKEEESSKIRRLGNWNPTQQEACYSTKHPMKPIWKLAGYDRNNSNYYNKRTVVPVPIALQSSTPIGEEIESGLVQVCALNDYGASKFTAYNFLRFLDGVLIFVATTSAHDAIGRETKGCCSADTTRSVASIYANMKWCKR